MKGDGFMKKFETPEVEVSIFAVEDVVTASTGFVPPALDDNQTPYG